MSRDVLAVGGFCSFCATLGALFFADQRLEIYSGSPGYCVREYFGGSLGICMRGIALPSQGGPGLAPTRRIYRILGLHFVKTLDPHREVRFHIDVRMNRG